MKEIVVKMTELGFYFETSIYIHKIEIEISKDGKKCFFVIENPYKIKSGFKSLEYFLVMYKIGKTFEKSHKNFIDFFNSNNYQVDLRDWAEFVTLTQKTDEIWNNEEEMEKLVEQISINKIFIGFEEEEHKKDIELMPSRS